MKAFAGLVAPILLGVSVAHAQSGSGRDPATLTMLWYQENEKCRGGFGDDPRTDAACAARKTYAKKLDALGWCYGKDGHAGFQMSWRGKACSPAMRRPKPSEMRFRDTLGIPNR
jgi:hypothetical protein